MCRHVLWNGLNARVYPTTRSVPSDRRYTPHRRAHSTQLTGISEFECGHLARSRVAKPAAGCSAVAHARLAGSTPGPQPGGNALPPFKTKAGDISKPLSS